MIEKFKLTNKQRKILKMLAEDSTRDSHINFINRIVFCKDRCFTFSFWRMVSFKTRKHAPGHFKYDHKTGTIEPYVADPMLDKLILKVMEVKDYKIMNTPLSNITLFIDKLYPGKKPAGTVISLNPTFITDMNEAGDDCGELYVPAEKQCINAFYKGMDRTIWGLSVLMVKSNGRFERGKLDWRI